MNITFEPEFQGYSNSRLSLSRKVDIWSSLNISSENIEIGSPCQRYPRLWTEFHFVQTPWWLGLETALLQWCVLNRRLPWLAPERELRRPAVGWVWPEFSVVRWFVCCFALDHASGEPVINLVQTESLLSSCVGCFAGIKQKRSSQGTPGTYCCCFRQT